MREQAVEFWHFSSREQQLWIIILCNFYGLVLNKMSKLFTDINFYQHAENFAWVCNEKMEIFKWWMLWGSRIRDQRNNFSFLTSADHHKSLWCFKTYYYYYCWKPLWWMTAKFWSRTAFDSGSSPPPPPHEREYNWDDDDGEWIV